MSTRIGWAIIILLALGLLAGCTTSPAQPTPTSVSAPAPTGTPAAAVQAPTTVALAATSTPSPVPPLVTTPAAGGGLVSGTPGPAAGTAVATTGVVTQSLAALGAPVFLENCSPCHGIDGQGNVGPALRNNPFVTGGDQTVFTTVANGIGTQMPAWLQANGGPLNDAQIRNVVAYLHTLQGVQPLPSSTPVPPEPTETPLPAGAPTPGPALPSKGGSVGPAVALTGDVTRGKAEFGLYCAACHGPEGIRGNPNPDSDDGSVPALNPIDPTLANADPKVFAGNVDVFIEHGSTPAGPNPLLKMPSFGDSKMLTPQQIADLIAYVISLNKSQ